MEPQVGALIQQIEYEVNRRLAQRQALIGELEQQEGAATRARSNAGLSQLITNAHSAASAAGGEPEVGAALERVKAAAEARSQTIARSLAEVNQVAELAPAAAGIENAEQLLAEAQRRASAYPELDDLQEIIVRVSAQVHGRRIEHDLICQELGSLNASISQALSPAELDPIRHRAVEIGAKHGTDPAIMALCEQIENDVRSARAKLLQTELQRLSQGQDVESSMAQMGTTDTASLVKKLQELVKTYPESVELRGMLLRAEDSLARAERARYEAAARASAIDLEVKAYTRLLESGQAAKTLSSLEEAAAKYPESEKLQSLLLRCREQIEAEQEAKRRASAEKAAMQAAIDKGTVLLKNRRYEEAAALLEVAGQQWPGDKQLEKLLVTARKAIDQQAAEEHERVIAELARMTESVKQVPLSESTDLLRRAARLSSDFSMEPQVGALIQQSEYEVNRRLAQRQALMEELAQLESTASRARSNAGLSQLVSNAHSVASAAAGEPEVDAALERVKAAAEARGQTITRLLAEVNQVANRAPAAPGIENAEQLLAEAQRRASAYPELDDLQEIVVRVSAQVHGRRIEHDLVCQELSSLHASISQALSPAELDSIRHRAVEVATKHGADPAIVALCEQIENDVRSARAKLLQAELQRLSQGHDVESSMAQMGTTDSASLVKKLQELIKTFPESGELRGMLLRAEDSLERAQRARDEAAARASAIDLEVKAYTRLLESGQAAKTLNSLEEAAAKYPESEQLQSLLLQCREQIEAEQEAKRQASAEKAAMQAAIDKGTVLIKNRRYEEAAALLEVAGQQWPGDKQLENLLATAARKRLIGKQRSRKKAGNGKSRLRNARQGRHADCYSSP